MRSISSAFDISSEKISTGVPWPTAAFTATLSTHAVLPMAGRAATTIRFSGCKPDVMSSKRVNPVGTPVTWRRFVERVSRLSTRPDIMSPTRR